MIPKSAVQAFQTNGYVVIPEFVDQEGIAKLKGQAQQIAQDGLIPQNNIFTTQNQEQHSDQYFLDSSHKVSCFFEEEAFDSSGELKYSKPRSINKIGHALHTLDPIFKKFAHSPATTQLFISLGLQKPTLRQSMYIFKQPSIGGAVDPHCDATFIKTSPDSCIGLWLALDDASQENGCLWVMPGSHRREPSQRFCLDPNSREIFFKGDKPSWDSSQEIPIECKAGTIVGLHGYLLHRSSKNNSPFSREAFTLHATDSSNSKWLDDNWMGPNHKFLSTTE